jgi:hypothetical protein
MTKRVIKLETALNELQILTQHLEYRNYRHAFPKAVISIPPVLFCQQIKSSFSSSELKS